MQRGDLIPGGEVHSSALVEEEGGHLDVSVVGGDVQRGEATLGLHGHVVVVLQQEGSRLGVILPGRARNLTLPLVSFSRRMATAWLSPCWSAIARGIKPSSAAVL